MLFINFNQKNLLINITLQTCMLHFITVSSNNRGESEITRDARPRFSVGKYSFVAYLKSDILLVQN